MHQEVPESAAVELAMTSLKERFPIALLLANAFKNAHHTLALVGGPVRDSILGRLGNDLDFTTDADPKTSQKLLSSFTDAIWTTGADFGTIACKIENVTIEITTYRSEKYDPSSRKPQVSFGSSIEDDLSRRDFTINAMALELTSNPTKFIDLHNGLLDLSRQIIDTPGTPEDSFSDDPLRMLRAARFASQLGFEIHPRVLNAMKVMSERLSIISSERVRDELIKILLSNSPRIGLTIMVETGLADYVIPELPLLRLEVDEHHHHKDVYEHTLKVLDQAIALESRLGGPNLTIRLAALLHDIGKPKTRELLPGGGVSFHHHEVVGSKMCKERLKTLRFDNQVVKDVAQLVFLHLRFHGYGDGSWTDSAVRRYVRDADHLIEHLHVLTRADCTTRNQRKAELLSKTYDQLENRIEALTEEEELSRIRPDLNGEEIMEILKITPSPVVGRAYQHLLELRLEHGPLPREVAIDELQKWWKLNQS